MKETIQTENAPKPLGPYSQGIRIGKLLYVSGQVAIDPREGKIVANDIKGQTVRVMENIKAILHAAGCSFSDVVQSTVYLSSVKLFSGFNNEYAKYFDKEYPARATVGAKLIPGALVEISVTAYKK